jgi:N-methylhydantoinase B
MTNTSNLPVEALELEYPLTLLRYELVDGSGGRGTQRGGMGLRRVYRAEADCRVHIDNSRLKSRPWGLEGGRGRPRRLRLRRAWCRSTNGNGDAEAGHIVEIITPGAGGYGPFSERADVQPDLQAVGDTVRPVDEQGRRRAVAEIADR